MAAATYVEHQVVLEPGDVVLMYSDGLVEAMNAAREQFGWERLHAVLTGAASNPSATEVRDEILREVWDFKGHTAQVDDVTMVVARCLASAPEFGPAGGRSSRSSGALHRSEDLGEIERETDAEGRS
jgi:serine/threonine protein phosphatase PrpC